jgi:hypothetical protein
MNFAGLVPGGLLPVSLLREPPHISLAFTYTCGFPLQL